MTFNDFVALPWVRWTVRLADWWDDTLGRIKLLFQKKEIMKIAVVGDLSMQEHSRLNKVLKAALKAADWVVMLGDMHSAYEVIQKHLKSGRLLVIPGNHDDKYDTIGQPRQWIKFLRNCTLVGLDNANDTFNNETWRILSQITPESPRPILVCGHKPLSNVVLSDGSENTHVMGESGSASAKADAVQLQNWLKSQNDCLYICGHWHGWTYQMTTYGPVLIEGRGGAAPDLGYTLFTIRKDGMVFHSFTL